MVLNSKTAVGWYEIRAACLLFNQLKAKHPEQTTDSCCYEKRHALCSIAQTEMPATLPGSLSRNEALPFLLGQGFFCL